MDTNHGWSGPQEPISVVPGCSRYCRARILLIRRISSPAKPIDSGVGNVWLLKVKPPKPASRYTLSLSAARGEPADRRSGRPTGGGPASCTFSRLRPRIFRGRSDGGRVRLLWAYGPDAQAVHRCLQRSRQPGARRDASRTHVARNDARLRQQSDEGLTVAPRRNDLCDRLSLLPALAQLAFGIAGSCAVRPCRECGQTPGCSSSRRIAFAASSIRLPRRGTRPTENPTVAPTESTGCSSQ
jgi:hypothetical protein